MKPFASEKLILPEYPRTRHLPWKPNTVRGDLVASEQESSVIFNGNAVIEEKIDGANSGMARYNGQPIIRNREHILRKGYFKDTPAKKQFGSIWNWYYQNEKKFIKLEKLAGTVSVYGEWMIAQHGINYDALPDWFVAYDLYDYEAGKFINPVIGRSLLDQAGFTLVPILACGQIQDFAQLEQLANAVTPFAADTLCEGVYVKVSEGNWITDRFKMVRQGFVQGALWSDKLNKNSLREN
jgi:hypothetical protein